MSIGSFFTHKIGPLPVWGYGAIAAGGTFLLLKGSGSKAPNKSGSGPASNAQGGSSTGSFTSNTTETISDDQTFGGGSLGFLGLPFFGGRNILVHMHHGGDGYWLGGRRYSDHAFRPFGFGRDGAHRGGFPGTDHRHGFAGGRDHHGDNDRGGHPRGFGQGAYNLFAGVGSRIAQGHHPGNAGARNSPRFARHLPADATPSNRR